MNRYDYTAALEGTVRFIERPDGTKLRTLQAGSGERTALLAHGYGSAAESWNIVMAKLVEMGMSVVVFDQRGHGQSTVGSDGVGTDQMASDYAAVLEAYSLTNAILVGHSMGGFLSLAFLLGNEEAKSRVGALLLMSTFAGDVSRDNPQNRLQIPLIKSGVLQKLVTFKPMAKAFTKSLIGDDFEDGMVDAFIPAFLRTDHAQLVPVLQAMVEENRYGRLGEIDMPCAVVVGSKDKTTPPFHTTDLHAGIRGSTLRHLPGVGHGPNWEAPDQIVEEIVALGER